MSSTDLTLSTLIHKYRNYIPAIGAGLIVLVCLYLSFQWISTTLATLDEIETNQLQITDLQGRIERLDTLKGGELDDIKSVVDSTLPKEKPVFETLEAVSVIASETETRVTNLQSRPGSVASTSGRIVVKPSVNSNSKPKKFENLSVNLEISGTFSNIRSFFEDLLSLAPLMELKTVRLNSTSVDETTGEQSFNSELELEVYWKPEISSSQNVNIQNSKIEQLTTEQIEILDAIEDLRRF